MNKVKVRIFTIADYEEEEVWLRSQHRKGLRLVKMIPPCFFVFEPCRPEDVVYRLDYRNGEQTGDYFQLFRDYGWEYCACCVGWLYFRKPASEVRSEEDGEIFSDDASRAAMIRHILLTRMLPLLIIFLCCLLPNWTVTLQGGFGRAGAFFSGVFTALLLLCLYLFIHCGGKLRKLQRRYEHR